MSNLLKSKLFLGVVIAGAMLVAVSLFAFAFVSTADAQACSITSTLRVGSRGTQVQCLQSSLGVTADGAFGPITKAAVQAWQTSKGLVADGVFGPLSRAAWSGSSVSGLPAGCTSTAGFSPTTGVPCNSGGTTSLPAGCTSTAGFSPTTGQSCSGGGSVVVGGPVSVSLAADNPAPSTLVAGQATGDLAHFAFMGSGTVTGVTLQRIGVSADSTPSNIYLFDGATRLTDAASVSSNGQVTFNVPAGIFTVAGSKNISVKSDIAAGTSGQTLGMMLKSFTTASGIANVNLSSNVHTIASATLAAVSAGTVTPSGATLTAGANVTVWQSTLSVSQRDVWMRRLALRNVGSASASAFQNLKLFVNGVQVATVAGLDVNGYATFDLSASPVLLVAGSRVVRVDADIVSGASRTVHFSLRRAGDVDFVDSSFGVNIVPTSTPWTATTASTISGSSGGTLTIEKDVSSPSTNIVNGGSDVNLGTFKVTAFGEPIKVETLRVAYTGSANIADDAGSLRNGRVLINGIQYGSTASLNETTDTVLAYTSYTVNYTFMPGVPALLEVHTDIFDDGGANDIVAGTDTIAAVIAVGSSNAIRQDSLGSFNAPASAVTANTRTIASTSVTLTKNATYTNQSTSLPATNFKIGAWTLAGSSVEDVLLTTLSVDINDGVAGTEFDEGDITNMYIVVRDASGAIVAQPSPIATLGTGADQNFSINYTLIKNANVTIELYANLSDDGLDMVAGVSGGAEAIDDTDGFATVLMVSGTSLVSGTAVTSGDGATTVAGQTISEAAATITVSKDASSPVTGIVYDNQTVTTVALKFAAVTAAYNLTDLTVTLGANANTVVQSVMLYDGATLVATAPLSTATTAVFSGLAWNIPANTNKVLTVKLKLGTIGPFAGTTGSVITTSIAAATNAVYTNLSTGVSTSSSTEEAGTATGSALYAYAAIPTITRVPLTDVVLRNGEKALLKFTLAANGGDVSWGQLYFNTSHDTDTALGTLATTGVSLWDTASNTAVAGVFTNTDNIVGDVETAGTILFVPTAEQVVSGSKTYELRGTITSANADGDYVTVTLANNTTSVVASNDLDDIIDNAEDDTIIWSDMSAASHDLTTTTDWTTDFGVRNLPISDSLNF